MTAEHPTTVPAAPTLEQFTEWFDGATVDDRARWWANQQERQHELDELRARKDWPFTFEGERDDETAAFWDEVSQIDPGEYRAAMKAEGLWPGDYDYRLEDGDDPGTAAAAGGPSLPPCGDPDCTGMHPAEAYPGMPGTMPWMDILRVLAQQQAGGSTPTPAPAPAAAPQPSPRFVIYNGGTGPSAAIADALNAALIARIRRAQGTQG